jgi:hypothetical protein
MNLEEKQSSKRFSFFLRTLLVLLFFMIYFVAAYPFMNLLGEWPAPFWLSVPLGVLLVFALGGKSFDQLTWIIMVAVLGYVFVWFSSIGIYRLPFSKWLYHHAKWYFQSSWADQIPIAIFMALVAFSLVEGRGRLGTSILFGEFLFFTVIIGNMLARFYLPLEGACGMDGFNYDAYGIRIGANFLLAVCLSFWMAKASNLLIVSLSRKIDASKQAGV